MKKHRIFQPAYLLWVAMIGISAMLAACQKDDMNGLECPIDLVIGSEEDIAGKWKLVKGEVVSSISKVLDVRDYSCKDIVYLFYSDGRLIISSDIEDYIGHDVGEYFYENALKPNNDEDVRSNLIKIDNRSYFMSMSASEMTIKLNPIDPLAVYESERTAYFVRIQ